MIPSSPHFSITEVTEASAPATAAEISAAARPIARTLDGMERVRAIVGGRPITLTSLLRTAADNEAADGSATSSHLTGEAADAKVSGMAPETVMRTVAPHVAALGIDQMILYHTHVHFGFGPRKRGQLLDARFGKPLRPWSGAAVTLAPVDVTASAPAQPAPSLGEIAGRVVFTAIAAAILWLFVSFTGAK